MEEWFCAVSIGLEEAVVVGKKEDNLPDIVVPTKITLQMQNPNMKGH